LIGVAHDRAAAGKMDKQLVDREAMPNTVACLAWAARQSGAKTVALPTGRVDADELRQVIVALTRARGGR
jgi:hypothetical protein